MSLKIMGFDIEAKQASDALKIAKREAIARGYVVADVVTRPYSVGRGIWRLELAVTEGGE